MAWFKTSERDGIAATTCGPPARPAAVNISAVGAGNRLKFYWAINGTPTWHPETVAGPGSVR
jgi:hypothetical protein